MKEELYDYLIDYGFDKNDLKELEQKNENVYYLRKENAIELIHALEEKGFSKEEIINSINNNYNLITTKPSIIAEYDNLKFN